MSRFDQRVREALADTEFAAGYWEADAEIEQIIASRSRIVVLESSAPRPTEQSSAGMLVRIIKPNVQPVIYWNPNVRDRALA